MSRKSGCPFSVKDYAVSILNNVTSLFVPIKGLNSLSVDVDADTEDGKTGDATWAEMFIRGRSVSGSLEGRPITDRTTGARDPGQDLIHEAAYNEGGCDNDQTIRIADAVGRAVEYDCVVTQESVSSDEDGETISWNWEGVGAPREIDYVQATAVAFAAAASPTTPITTLSVAAGSTASIVVNFTPNDASNQRFAYSMEDKSKATVSAIDGKNLTISGIAAGSTTLTIKSMNNNLTATLAITVTTAED